MADAGLTLPAFAGGRITASLRGNWLDARDGADVQTRRIVDAPAQAGAKPPAFSACAPGIQPQYRRHGLHRSRQSSKAAFADRWNTLTYCVRNAFAGQDFPVDSVSRAEERPCAQRILGRLATLAYRRPVAADEAHVLLLELLALAGDALQQRIDFVLRKNLLIHRCAY